MPMSPAKPCMKSGCPNLHRNSMPYCNEHMKQYMKEVDSRRGNSKERGYNTRWQKSRLMFLHQFPLCIQCHHEGRVTVGTVVDHIKPHKGNMDLFWDTSNWQTLCKPCHDKKTSLEGAFGHKVEAL